MKITIESTNTVVMIMKGGVEVPGRVWIGHTESGIPAQCVITRIGVPSGANQEEFQRELLQCSEPREQIVFPLRMVL